MFVGPTHDGYFIAFCLLTMLALSVTNATEARAGTQSRGRAGAADAASAGAALPVTGGNPDTTSRRDDGDRLAPADLLTVTTVEDLALSANGQRLLATVTRRDRPVAEPTTLHLRIDVDGGDREDLPLPEAARQVRWRPGSNAVTYVAPHDGKPQVWVRPDSGSARPVTAHQRGVIDYEWSPSGERLAFSARGRPSRKRGPGSERAGVEISVATFHQARLSRDRLTSPPRPERRLWTVRPGEGRATQVTGDLSVTDYAWGPGSSRLAFTASQESGRLVWRTDLFLWREGEGADEVRRLAAGQRGTELEGGARNWNGAVSLASPFWGPDGRRVGFVRIERSPGMSSTSELRMLDLDTGTARTMTSTESVPLPQSGYRWLPSDRVLFETVRRGRGGLFAVPVGGGARTERVIWSHRHGSHFSLSADGETAAWVRQSAGRPPEVHLSEDLSGDSSTRRLTGLNDHLDDERFPRVRLRSWESSDGTRVEGWLLLPSDRRPDGRLPLLVFLHGGPGIPSKNAFRPYGGGWPYPFQAFTSRGYAVFLPNYRGTESYGDEFEAPTRPDGEPVRDVLSGIDMLVDEGVADSTRIGILGHSHGAWLGPMIVAERPDLFAAASFAEGRANSLSAYGQVEGWRARNVVAPSVGASPYDRPERYLELSPAFRERAHSTPMLLEYGQRGMAIQGLELASALWDEGTPHDLVVYRNAGHGLRSPKRVLASMRRNLDWFSRWMEPGSEPASTD